MDATAMGSARLPSIDRTLSPTAWLASFMADAGGASSGQFGHGGLTDTGGHAARADTVIKVVSFADRRPVTLHPRSADHLCRLIEGWACRAHLLRDGTRQITDVLLPGDLLSEGMAAHGDHGGETFACGMARVAILRRDHFARTSPSAFHRIREQARETELRILRSRLVSLGRQNARERVAHFFAELHARLDRSGLVVDDGFTCPLTQEQVADVLGLTSVHINRTLQQLRAEGLLLIRRPNVVILDLRRLHDVGDFDTEDHATF